MECYAIVKFIKLKNNEKYLIKVYPKKDKSEVICFLTNSIKFEGKTESDCISFLEEYESLI